MWTQVQLLTKKSFKLEFVSRNSLNQIFIKRPSHQIFTTIFKGVTSFECENLTHIWGNNCISNNKIKLSIKSINILAITSFIPLFTVLLTLSQLFFPTLHLSLSQRQEQKWPCLFITKGQHKKRNKHVKTQTVHNNNCPSFIKHNATRVRTAAKHSSRENRHVNDQKVNVFV